MWLGESGRHASARWIGLLSSENSVRQRGNTKVQKKLEGGNGKKRRSVGKKKRGGEV